MAPFKDEVLKWFIELTPKRTRYWGDYALIKALENRISLP
jgi:hypothetical protein